MIDSFLLLAAWSVALCIGLRSMKTTAPRFLAVNILILALFVELSEVLGLSHFVTRNLGASAVALLVAYSVANLQSKSTLVRLRTFTLLGREYRHVWALAAIPFLSLVGLRILDGPGWSAWLSPDLGVFAGAEDNAKWLGAASALRVGEAPGVSAIGGFLVVALRGSLAFADVLGVLGMRSVSTELGSVLFATQFVRELLVTGSPFLALLVVGTTRSPRLLVKLALSLVVIITITQAVAMNFGFLSFQVSLFVGSSWILSLKYSARGDRSWQLVSVLSGGVFLLSWLPLRLFFPAYVAINLRANVFKVSRVQQAVLLIAATAVSFSTFRYILDIGGSNSLLRTSRTADLFAASGGVFAISPYLVIFALFAVALIAVKRAEWFTLPSEVTALMVYSAMVFLMDLLLNGQLGYGSTKLLFLLLCLIIVLGISNVCQVNLNSRTDNSIVLICLGLSLLTVTSYGYGLSMWGAPARAALSTTEDNVSSTTLDLRLRDPLVVLHDYVNLRDILERERVCSDRTCDLEEMPSFCLAIYTETRKVRMQPRAITRIDSLSSGDINEYKCTRFLTELSRSRASKSELQGKLFFATQDRLRDALTWIVQESPNTKVLVAFEGRNQPAIMEVSSLVGLSRQLYPDVPFCRQDFGTVDRVVNCQR